MRFQPIAAPQGCLLGAILCGLAFPTALTGEDATGPATDAPAPPVPPLPIEPPPALHPGESGAAHPLQPGEAHPSRKQPGEPVDGFDFLLVQVSPNIDRIRYTDRDNHSRYANSGGTRYGLSITHLGRLQEGATTSPYGLVAIDLDFRQTRTTDGRSIQEFDPMIAVGCGLLTTCAPVTVYAGPEIGFGYAFISDPGAARGSAYSYSGDGGSIGLALDLGVAVDLGEVSLIGQAGYEVRVSAGRFGDADSAVQADYVSRGLVFSLGFGRSF